MLCWPIADSAISLKRFEGLSFTVGVVVVDLKTPARLDNGGNTPAPLEVIAPLAMTMAQGSTTACQ